MAATNWLMLEGFNDYGTMRMLADADIMVTEMTVEMPEAITGVAFPEYSLYKVLDLLGRRDIRFNRMQTDKRRVTLMKETSIVTATENARQAEMPVRRTSNANIENWNFMLPVLEEFADTMGLKIRVSNPHGYAHEPVIDDGKLYIWFWSIPDFDDKEEERYMDSAFGIKLTGSQRDGMAFSGVGNPILDENGMIVAEYLGNNLYVHFDLPHGRDTNILIRHIMEAFVVQYSADPKMKEKFAKQREKAIKAEAEASRLLYIQECSKRMHVKKDKATASLAQAKKNVQTYQVELVAKLRQIMELEAELAVIEKLNGGDDGKFDAEFTSLCNVPGVERVRVKDSIVQVFTDSISIPYDGDEYEIGKFRIDIYTDGSEGGVRCYNLTKVVDGWMHPHVDGEGWCCLGNIGHGIAELTASYEFAVIAQIMMQYLATYNDADPMHGIGHWPRKKVTKKEEVA